MKLLFFLITLSVSFAGLTQTLPMGLYEGLLGNSGVALQDATAASAYNPSLLRDRADHSFSLGGNAFGSHSARSSGSEFSSLSLSPTYLSTVINGSALVHEFFYASRFSGQQDIETKDVDSTLKLSNDLLASRFGYSMAYKSIPFAMQFLGRYSQSKSLGFGESYSAATQTTISSQHESQNRYFGFSLGLSGHARFGGYSLGANLISRGLDVYRKSQGRVKTYIFTPTSLTTSEDSFDSGTHQEAGYQFSVGHGFQNGDHQFLTDTNLTERSDLSHAYTWTQSFGYKMNSARGHQFLCGIQHQLGQEIKYLGQAMFSTVGYSWQKRALRSTFGIYHSNTRLLSQTSTTYGLTFGSEFQY